MVFSLRKLAVVLGGVAVLMAGAPRLATAGACNLYDLASTCPTSGFYTYTNSYGPSTTNTGFFTVDEQHPTGTGVIDSFLRIQQNGWEQGYNTSYRPIESDMHSKTDPNFTRNLLTSEVGTKVINGITYYEFFLDVNEPATTNNDMHLITLDQLEIYVSNTANLNDYRENVNNGQLCLAGQNNNLCKNAHIKIFDLDAGGDNWINIDYLVSGQGSGSSDMVFYLNSSIFANYTYVYLFSQFGDKYNVWNKYESRYASEAGFEEWFVKRIDDGGNGPLTPVPEPATVVLLGSGLAVAARRWRRARAA